MRLILKTPKKNRKFLDILSTMTKVKTIIDKAKEYYFKEWRGNEKVCPAFGEKVYITRLGWNHIVNIPRRRLVDKIIRLKNLKVAREILETANTYQTTEKKGPYYRYGLWVIKGDRKFKVVVSSKGRKGRKVLLSFMVSSLTKRQQIKIDRHNKKIIAKFRKKHPRRRKSRRKR